MSHVLRAPLLLWFMAALVGCAPQASSSPTATATGSPTVSATFSASAAPTATAGPASSHATGEQLADALADVLGRSDYTALAGLVTPTGWVGGFYQSEGTKQMTRQETIDWLKARARNGTLEVSVQTRPVLPHAITQPPGDSYVRSTWANFATVPTQNVDLVLRNEAGSWYWSGALFNAPQR